MLSFWIRHTIHPHSLGKHYPSFLSRSWLLTRALCLCGSVAVLVMVLNAAGKYYHNGGIADAKMFVGSKPTRRLTRDQGFVTLPSYLAICPVSFSMAFLSFMILFLFFACDRCFIFFFLSSFIYAPFLYGEMLLPNGLCSTLV